MDFDMIRKNIDDGLYDLKNGVFERDFDSDVEDAFGSEFRVLSPEVRSKIHYMAYDKGHAYGLHSILSKYFDIIELTACMVKTMNFR